MRFCSRFHKRSASPTGSAVLISDDIVPRFEGDKRPIDHAALKAQTLLNDMLYFDLPAVGQENIVGTQLVYEDLLNIVKKDAPKRGKELRNIWKPLPVGFNTAVNRDAYRAVEYGAESDLPGFLELDYFMSTALMRMNKVYTGAPRFSRTQFHDAIHAGWVWCANGIGFATSDPCLFNSVGLFAKSVHNIRFDGNPESLEDVLKAVQTWEATSDDLHMKESPTQIFRWLIPDFGRLSWDHILKLRDHRMHEKFRQWYASQHDRLADSKLRNAVQDEIMNALWKLALKVEPNVKRTAITALIGNLPTGPIPFNPVGIGTSVADVMTDVNRQRTQGWLFWLAEAKALATL